MLLRLTCDLFALFVQQQDNISADAEHCMGSLGDSGASCLNELNATLSALTVLFTVHMFMLV